MVAKELLKNCIPKGKNISNMQILKIPKYPLFILLSKESQVFHFSQIFIHKRIRVSLFEIPVKIFWIYWYSVNWGFLRMS